jgi:hypothetical protein
MNTTLYFGFEFVDESIDLDESDVQVMYFTVTGNQQNIDLFNDQIQSMTHIAEDQFDCVHDTTGQEGEIVGFSTYEADKSQYNEIMSYWQTQFVNQGFVVSTFRMCTTDEYDILLQASL